MTTQERNDLYCGFESLSFTPRPAVRGCVEVVECWECPVYQGVDDEEEADNYCRRCTVA